MTDAELANPDPADWLMGNRTLDEQRFSPLDQINTKNVGGLTLAWGRGLTSGTQESSPLVHDGVMYIIAPGGIIQAVDATNGDLIWEYAPDYPRSALPNATRSKNLAIFQDMIYFGQPTGDLVALEATTGKVRWKTKVDDGGIASGGLLVADGKVISNRTCEGGQPRNNCFIAAHDALTGKEVWKFYTTAAKGEPGGDTWGDIPTEKRAASPWGLPGSYDPVRGVLYYGVANPMPYTVLKRYGPGVKRPDTSPTDLYGNSTVALDVKTGKLRWYYQEMPSDTWDLDHNHERFLIRTKVSPDPKYVKWISSSLKPGQTRDVVVTVAEGGSLFMVERQTGKFLWAIPFPADGPDNGLKDIDVKTGKTIVNTALGFSKDGEKRVVCSYNTRSWYSLSYNPQTNALYVPFHNICLSMSSDNSDLNGSGPRVASYRPGSDPQKFMQLAKVDMTTGEMKILYSQPQPASGSALTTAGGLVFNGDLNRHLRAFDATTGEILWDQRLGGMVVASTITYAVKGRQYVMVFTGEGMSGSGKALALAGHTMAEAVRGHPAVYVFALPKAPTAQ